MLVRTSIRVYDLGNAETRSADGIFHPQSAIFGSLELSTPCTSDGSTVSNSGESLLWFWSVSPQYDLTARELSSGLWLTCPHVYLVCVAAREHPAQCSGHISGVHLQEGSSFRINRGKMYWGTWWVEWYGFCVTLGLSLLLPRSASIL